MAQMTLRIHRFLSQGAQAESPGLEEIPVSFSVGERLESVVRRLAAEDRALGRALCKGNAPTIQPGILVVLNDHIINRSEYETATLADGDDVTFLPMMDGG